MMDMTGERGGIGIKWLPTTTQPPPSRSTSPTRSGVRKS
jgi:hypothetical protein